MNNPQLQSVPIDEARSSTHDDNQLNQNDEKNKEHDKLDGIEEMMKMVENDEPENDDPAKRTQGSNSKVTAVGMMDIALLTANGNQLRFLLTYNSASPTYYVSLSLVIISLVLQICVGIMLIFRRQMKSMGNDDYKITVNNLITLGIFLITLINVFVASFTMIESPKTNPV